MTAAPPTCRWPWAWQLRPLLVVLLTALAVVPAAGWSAPAPSTADVVEQLASRAKTALAAGQFDVATELYLGAWQQDQRQTALVFNAARAQHLGSHYDKAEALYRQFLGLPGADPALMARAQAYLQAIALSRADARAAEGRQLQELGRYAEAAAAFRDAFRLAPSRPELLLSAARAARLTADLASAVATYRAYLQLALADADRQEAIRELALLEAKVRQAEAPVAVGLAAAPTAVGAPPDTTPTAAPETTVRWQRELVQAVQVSYTSRVQQGAVAVARLELGGRSEAGTGVYGALGFGIAATSPLSSAATIGVVVRLAGTGALVTVMGVDFSMPFRNAAVLCPPAKTSLDACLPVATEPNLLRVQIGAEYPLVREHWVSAGAFMGFLLRDEPAAAVGLTIGYARRSWTAPGAGKDTP